MQKKENLKKCDKNCASCKETNCADDYRLICYGSKCQTCDLECSLKAAGGNFAKEKKEDKFTATHSIINRSMELFDNLAEAISDENNITISPVRQAQLDTARKMAFFYIEHPAEFDKFVMQFFLGKNQTAIAKERNMTRANISKRIITERGDKLKKEIADLKKQNSAFATMTATELKVYQLCGVDGILNISNIAKQGGISRQTVYNTLHNLSEKYGIRFTLDRNRRKKS